MIYFTTQDQKHVVIVDHAAIDLLREGHAIISPDGFVFVALTPDEKWTAERFQEAFSTGDMKLTSERMKAILAEGFLRQGPLKVILDDPKQKG